MIGGSGSSTELAAIEPWRSRASAITRHERQARMERARRLLVEAGADSLLVCAGPSLSYFTGIGWRMIERLVALVLTPRSKPVIICPAFEAGSLAAVLELEAEVQFWEEHEDPAKLIASILRNSGAVRLAVDPALPFGMAERLRVASPSVAALDAAAIIDGCRMIKSPAELLLLQEAKDMTLSVHRRAARILTPGIRASEVRQFIDDAHKRIGTTGSTFCTVQFGASTAIPHGLPGDDVLEEGDMVLIDTGCCVRGYHSDITRSYVFGRPSADQRTMWNVAREAQQAAFAAARPGIKCQEIDAAARWVIEHRGLGPGYRLPGLPHRTGHGIGMSLHEAPYLVRGDATPLRSGMCVSDEPTIVIPGHFGVRLEDHFHITEDGAAWFTQPPADMEAPFAPAAE